MCIRDRTVAVGTSLAAIVPTATVGVISYAMHGSVAWIPALILAAFAVIGAQIGTWLLARLPQNALRWGFVVFLAFVIVMMFVVVPSRDAELVLTWGTGIALAALGLITGILAGLLGVGGGVVVVPALMIFFGTSDLIAKGTSLLMMIPTAISGTIGNLRRQRRPARRGADRGSSLHHDGARRVVRGPLRSGGREHPLRGVPRLHRRADGVACPALAPCPLIGCPGILGRIDGCP